jgi:hypothetical protein
MEATGLAKRFEEKPVTQKEAPHLGSPSSAYLLPTVFIVQSVNVTSSTGAPSASQASRRDLWEKK